MDSPLSLCNLLGGSTIPHTPLEAPHGTGSPAVAPEGKAMDTQTKHEPLNIHLNEHTGEAEVRIGESIIATYEDCNDADEAREMAFADRPDLFMDLLFDGDVRGNSIPHDFATGAIHLHKFEGLHPDDLAVLEAGEVHEHYWEAWDNVLMNAVCTDPKYLGWKLHYNTHLWIYHPDFEWPEGI